MVRDMTKLRNVGGTSVVTLTQAILSSTELKDGDRLLLEALPPNRVIITKEVEMVANSRRAELELQVLERKRDALCKHMECIGEGLRLNMPEPGFEDDDIARLTAFEFERDKANLEVEIAQKQLELFDLQGH